MDRINGLVLTNLLGLFVWQLSFNAFAIDVEKVAQDNFTKINQLKQVNRKLLGNIEQLQEQQKLNRQKITELFNLLKHKTSHNAKKAVILQIEGEDRAAKKAYNNARAMLITGQYDQAIDGFSNYLEHYPNNNKISTVHYWLGKTFAAKNDYQNAKKTFTDFQKNYPLHAKFANSLYELALVQNKLGEKQAALQLLQTLVKKFPNHDIVVTAQDLLTSIKQATTSTVQK